MFYEYAEKYIEPDEEMPLSVGISKPDNRMLIAWGNKKMYLNEQEMLAVIQAMMLTYEQWSRDRVSGWN